MIRPLLLALLLAGCANDYWYFNDHTQEEFQADDYACLRDAYATGGATYSGLGTMAGKMAYSSGTVTPNVNVPMYRRCMASKGYTRKT